MSDFAGSSAYEEEMRCRIDATGEILAILRELRDTGTLCTAEFARNDFIVTTILEVIPDARLLVIDLGADAAANRRLRKAPRIHLDTHQGEIRVRFSCDRARSILFADKPALGLPLPTWVVRLQRRESYRLRIPRSQQVRLMAKLEADADATEWSVRVLDISCGGIALMDLPTHLGLECGKTYRACRIELPDGEKITTDIEVRHLKPMHGRAGEGTLRCGCRFVNLTPAKVTRIQRFIFECERQRLVDE